ncbi:MAG: hypothetical protein Ct9H90mP18_09900 [Gammaproteobacteria bacterium]|nr:MAG: hypothetical protein Ct9H90mP18_09900 [Gammaproteobacteria bacterium]
MAETDDNKEIKTKPKGIRPLKPRRCKRENASDPILKILR